MKKLLCGILAVTALFCLAGCEDGKCDDCKTEKNVKVYEIEDKNVELCPSCLIERGVDNVTDGIMDGLFGD